MPLSLSIPLNNWYDLLTFDLLIRNLLTTQICVQSAHTHHHLTSTTLPTTAGNLIGPFNTPYISSPRTAYLSITADVANGVVGFSDGHAHSILVVEEPDGRNSLTNRVGWLKLAAVVWLIFQIDPMRVKI